MNIRQNLNNIMKTLNQYIKEKLIINKDYKDYRDDKIIIKSFDELRKIIEDRYDKLGPGTKENPIDFNDIDVSNIISFCNNKNKGIFENTNFKYINISDWNVSNVTDMRAMFFKCKELKSIGNISGWDMSKVTNMTYMFGFCKKFNQDISNLNVSNVTNMLGMFYGCESFNQDISNWDVSNVTNMADMFHGCRSFNQDISKWDVSNLIIQYGIFYHCPIKEEYKPKFK